MVPWNRIQLALMSPPPTPIRGTIVSREPESKHFAGATVDHEVRESAATASEHTVHVWRDGARLRVESNDGEPLYFCDGVHSWTPRSDRGWLVSPASPHGYHGPGRQILTVRGPAEWSDDDFTRPARSCKGATITSHPTRRSPSSRSTNRATTISTGGRDLRRRRRSSVPSCVARMRVGESEKRSGSPTT